MTPEQLTAELTAAPDLLSHAAGLLANNQDVLTNMFLPKFTELGYTIRNKDDEAAYRATIESTLRPKIEAEIIPANDKKHYTAIEQLVFETTGINKEQNEKATEYLKRATGQLKTNGVSDQMTKAQLEALQKELSTSKESWAKEKETLLSTHFAEKLNGYINSELKGINFNVPSTLNDDEKQKYSAAQSDLIKSAFSKFTTKTNEAGEIMFFDGDIPFIDQKNGKALTPEEIVKNKFGYLLAKDVTVQQHAGAGSGKKDVNGKTVYQSKEAVYNAIKTEGLAENTKAFSDEYEKRCRESGLIK